MNKTPTGQDKSTKKQHIRHLDHLSDITDGHAFTAVPGKLSELYIDKKIPETKFRLIYVMLTHSKNFQIWSSYLRKRFSPSTLKKYLPEIIADGYVRVDKIRGDDGGLYNVYHTNPLAEWKIYQEVDADTSSNLCSSVNSSSVNSSSVNSSSVNDITKTTSNKTKNNQNNDNFGTDQQAAPKKKITKSNLIGKLQTGYVHLSREQASSLIDEMNTVGAPYEAIDAIFDKKVTQTLKNLTMDHRMVFVDCARRENINQFWGG